jgi:signal peptidase I
MSILKSETFKDYAGSFFNALVIFVILYIFLWPLGVNGFSMEPALNDGDRVFISRAMAFFGMFDRGDIVMIKPEKKGADELIIKRLIALPGEKVEIKSNKLYINGEEYKEAYLNDSYKMSDMSVMLSETEYFFMGDNRDLSFDSRSFGALDKESLKAVIIFRWFPINSMLMY